MSKAKYLGNILAMQQKYFVILVVNPNSSRSYMITIAVQRQVI